MNILKMVLNVIFKINRLVGLFFVFLMALQLINILIEEDFIL